MKILLMTYGKNMEIAKKIIKLGVAFVMNNVECFINDMKKYINSSTDQNISNRIFQI